MKNSIDEGEFSFKLVEMDEVCETYSDVPHLLAIPMKIRHKISSFLRTISRYVTEADPRNLYKSQ